MYRLHPPVLTRGVLLGIAVAIAGSSAYAQDFIELGGQATGFLAISNFKNSVSQNGLEAKNTDGSFNSGHNGLPDYPNYLVPAGSNNAGVYTAIIASPQSTMTDYATLFSDAFHGGSPITVNNQVVNDADFSTLSAGRIEYDASLYLDASGTGTVPVSGLTFDLNRKAWDGSINGDGGSTGLPTPGPNADNPWVVPDGPGGDGFDPPLMISAFSPIDTIYNDGSGAGNAAIIYMITVDNLVGNGLEFVNGELTSMDISGDLTVGAQAGQAVVLPPVLFGEGEDSNPKGTFTASGLDYAFDLIDTESASIFSGINMLMNRAGTLASPSLLLGDYNRDGSVNAADYTIWADNFGSMVSLDADGNDNGVIDAADYTIWADNFGQTAGSLAPLHTIPEPTSIVVVTLVALSIRSSRARRA
ncbi:MAG: hypothetical protein AAF911_02790 [Planctomycetota bacterium]